MIRALIYEQFSGGWSVDKKIGIKNSQAYTQSLDFRKHPSQMSVLPSFVDEDNGVVKDLLQNEVMTGDGTIYGLGSAGTVYKRTVGAVWSAEGSIGTNGTFGVDYRKDTDSIYLTGPKTASVVTQVSKLPILFPNYYAASYSTFNNSDNTFPLYVAAYQAGSSQVYQPPTVLSEAPTDLRYFQSDIEPLNQISVFVVNKGTGDWTLTLHDGLNNVLATATVTNANLQNNTFNNFVFTSATNGQVRIYVAPNARTYHIHVTSTVLDGTLSCSTVNDLSTCDLEVWADRFVQTNNGMHPTTRYQQWEVFGNGNYVSLWEPISDPPTNVEWQRHKFVYPMEYEVLGLATTNEFLVAALEKNTTVNTQIPQEGLITFWGGVNPTYDYYLTIPEGSPQCLHTYKNVVYYYAGGDWYALTSPTTLPVKIRNMPDSDTEFSGVNSPITIYPYAATVRRGIHLMAYPSSTTNSSINYGVYSYGSVDKNFDDSFGYSYLLPSGTQNYSGSNNLTIGMVKNFGDLLHVSYRDDLNGGYGVGVITNTSKPAGTAVWQSLIFDGGRVSKPKSAKYIEVYYSLPSGASIQLGYNINRGSLVTDTNTYTSTNLWQKIPGYARFDVTNSNGGRFFEFQQQLTITCDSTVSTPPVIYQIGFVFDDNREEQY